MFKKMEKIKNLFGYQNSEEVVETPIIEEKESIKKDIETQNVLCDCCGNNEITINVTDMYKLDTVGNKTPLFEHPQVDMINGGIYDDVAICDECFSQCATESQKQYIWLIGKGNALCKEIELKATAKETNLEKMQAIELQAQAEINDIYALNQQIDLEANELMNMVEHLAQEKELLEQNI